MSLVSHPQYDHAFSGRLHRHVDLMTPNDNITLMSKVVVVNSEKKPRSC